MILSAHAKGIAAAELAYFAAEQALQDAKDDAAWRDVHPIDFIYNGISPIEAAIQTYLSVINFNSHRKGE
jgi:hypothetical protein